MVRANCFSGGTREVLLLKLAKRVFPSAVVGIVVLTTTSLVRAEPLRFLTRGPGSIGTSHTPLPEMPDSLSFTPSLLLPQTVNSLLRGPRKRVEPNVVPNDKLEPEPIGATLRSSVELPPDSEVLILPKNAGRAPLTDRLEVDRQPSNPATEKPRKNGSARKATAPQSKARSSK